MPKEIQAACTKWSIDYAEGEQAAWDAAWDYVKEHARTWWD